MQVRIAGLCVLVTGCFLMHSPSADRPVDAPASAPPRDAPGLLPDSGAPASARPRGAPGLLPDSGAPASMCPEEAPFVCGGVVTGFPGCCDDTAVPPDCTADGAWVCPLGRVPLAECLRFHTAGTDASGGCRVEESITCEAYLAQAEPSANVACDPAVFGTSCQRPGNAFCCRQTFSCEDGVVVETYMSRNCDDECAWRCSTAESALNCSARWNRCEWLEPGCGDAPEGAVTGPRCIDARGAACERDEDCLLPERCLTYWINPCVGSACAACGAEERRCAIST